MKAHDKFKAEFDQVTNQFFLKFTELYNTQDTVRLIKKKLYKLTDEFITCQRKNRAMAKKLKFMEK